MRAVINNKLQLVMKTKTTTKALFTILASGIIVTGGLISPYAAIPAGAVSVAELRAQNNELQAQINANNAKAKELSTQADTLQNKLASLDAQVAQLQAQIDLTKNKIAELQINLEKAQVELDRQKELLKASIQALYKKGGASTVELLIGSDSFSQFINDQTYLERLKSGIQTSTEKVIELKQQIQLQQTEQKGLLAQKQSQQQSLNATKNEQQALLDQTKGQEANYKQAVSTLRAQQAQVMAQIAARMVASGTTVYAGDGSNGGYPTRWASAPQNRFVDDWGMYSRQCVSYTAFKVAQSGRFMPHGQGQGNAREWTSNARPGGIWYQHGVRVDRNPRVGDVAITYNGYYGHSMYVEAVNGRMVTVSQYNFDSRGNYSEMTVSADNSMLGPMDFVHFP